MSTENVKKIMIIDDSLFSKDIQNTSIVIQRSFNLINMLLKEGYECTYVSKNHYSKSNDSNIIFIRIKYPEEVIKFFKTIQINDIHYDLIINNGCLHNFYGISHILRNNINKCMNILDQKISFNDFNNIKIINSDAIVFSNENAFNESENELIFADEKVNVQIIQNNEIEKYTEFINGLLG